MGQARVNARRRRQAAQGFAHLGNHPQRPHYAKADAEVAARRLDALIKRENEMRMRTKRKG